MVAAGVGAKVGLKLFVIGDGRWKTANFPTLAIDPQMVTWDFTAQRSDYTLIRDRESQKFDGRAWTLEASVDLMRSQIPVTYEPLPSTPDAAVPAKDTGAVVDSATSDAGEETETSAEETGTADAATDTGAPTPPDYDAGAAPGVDPYASDLEVAFGTDSARRVTRLRADLASKYLDVDLVLEADGNQAVLPRELQVSKAVNENCPPSSNAQSSSSSDGCDCNVVVTNKKLHVPVGLCAAAFALALVRRRRR
jgi:hypothetical protein